MNAPLRAILEAAQGPGILMATAYAGDNQEWIGALELAVRQVLVRVEGSRYRLTEKGAVALGRLEG